jgi:hypothetical protein
MKLKKFGWKQYCSLKCQKEAKKKRVERICGNPKCKRIVSRILSQFKKSKSGLIFYSKSCAAKVNNERMQKGKRNLKSVYNVERNLRKVSEI